jgi:hypothetical protein
VVQKTAADRRLASGANTHADAGAIKISEFSFFVSTRVETLTSKGKIKKTKIAVGLSQRVKLQLP